MACTHLRWRTPWSLCRPRRGSFCGLLLKVRDEGEIIAELHDEIQQELNFRNLYLMSLLLSFEILELDEVVDILQVHYQIRTTENILAAMSQRDRRRIQDVLEYPEDSAGGLNEYRYY